MLNIPPITATNPSPNELLKVVVCIVSVVEYVEKTIHKRYAAKEQYLFWALKYQYTLGGKLCRFWKFWTF